MRIKYFFKDIIHTIKSIYLCIRFPFLYPRNVWSGLHYNSWGICNYLKEFYQKHATTTTDRSSGSLGIKVIWDSKINKFIHKAIRYYHDNILQIIHCIPTHSRFDDIPAGWRKAFGIQMCEEIKKELKRYKYLHKYRITQIKEKYGTLHWYDYGSPGDVGKIIMKYEYISKYTCVHCGRIATACTPVEYYASPYCDDCFPKSSKYRLEYGIYEGFYGYTGNINNRPDEVFNEMKKNVDEYKGVIDN